MSITVRIPTPLRKYTDGEGRIAVSADTVGDAFGSLVDRYPELRQHLFDDEGGLRNFVNAYLNEEDVRELEGEETPLSEGDTVVIVPSIAGGSGNPVAEVHAQMSVPEPSTDVPDYGCERPSPTAEGGRGWTHSSGRMNPMLGAWPSSWPGCI